ncbi:recombinase family protein [Mesorhizobium sp. B1-1-5]|uniref:recombinase family protein n=1 Tax=Mesorhizobium sp. B1-1-5 TaxID=2589979 RepID=UPI001126AEF4|nr:recombinase family protein [Mesorhizobium sp. B1-1-5]TPO05168.1 recombinase family protein [Mesorhizobium sp. B1-1-5]
MLIGYARTSTLDQEAGLAAQVRDLTALGCEKIFSEQVSATGQRRALESAIDFAREGDTLVVTKLDRLARSVKDIWGVLDRLRCKAVAVKIENMGIDTGTPTGKLMLSVLGGVAEFEREMMLERQREGIAKAKTEGRYRGRKPVARDRGDEILALRRSGESLNSIARQLRIGKATVFRFLREIGGSDKAGGKASSNGDVPII